jgi:predicted outer membrane repeat protein
LPREWQRYGHEVRAKAKRTVLNPGLTFGILQARRCGKMERSVFLVCVTFFMLVSGVVADTWYVKPDGTGDVPSIQAAVDTVAPGDTVLLASGTYTGTGNYDIVVPNQDLLLISETGAPADCIIDCQGYLDNNRRGFRFDSGFSTRVVRGITIRNGVKWPGGGVNCEGSLTMRDCVFESNTSAYGGGAIAFSTFGGWTNLKNCVFVSNEALGDFNSGGGAILIEGIDFYVTIDSCTFYDNVADRGGAIYCYVNEGAINIGNCLFVGNSAQSKGGAIDVYYTQVTIGHCTFHANHATTGSGVYTNTWDHAWDYAMAAVEHCIIAYGTGGCGYCQDHYNPDDPSLRCTNIYGNEGGDYPDSLATRLGVDGNFSACPAFCNAVMEPYDLSLCDQSPCLPGNHPDGYACGLIGALGEGCICDPTRTEPTTWGAIKALYR